MSEADPSQRGSLSSPEPSADLADGPRPDANEASRRGAPIRVLSLPGRRFPHNPYLRLFCDAFRDTGVEIVDLRSRQALLFRFDIVHVHFPEHYVSAQTLPRAVVWCGFYAATFFAAKLLGKRIVWMVHNVLPFQDRHPWLLGPWMRLFRRLVDAHVFLSRSSRNAFAERFPQLAGKPACVVPHGAFAVPAADPQRQADWRARVAPAGPAFLVGFLGSIKQYKNILALAALPACLGDGRRVQAVVAGTPDLESKADLAAILRELGERVTYLPERIADNDLHHLIRAMDVVILPYRKGWNSGFAMLVLGNRTKLLTSDLPMFRELRAEVGAPWVTIDAAGATGLALEDVAGRPADGAADRRLRTFLEASAFENGAARLAQFYRACLAI